MKNVKIDKDLGLVGDEELERYIAEVRNIIWHNNDELRKWMKKDDLLQCGWITGHLKTE